MTVHVRADGEVSRRLFTVAEVGRMVDADVFEGEDRFELIEGEVVAMSPVRYTHERVKSGLIGLFVRTVGEEIYVAIQSSLRLSAFDLPEPDIMICRMSDLKPSSENFTSTGNAKTLLIIEVSDSTISFDRGRKARLYAGHNEPEYWVVDVNERQILVHSEPADGAYQSVIAVSEAMLTPLAPELGRVSVRLDTLF